MRTPTMVVLFAGVALLGGCAKQEPVAETVRPVLLVQAVVGGATSSAVFAGEVKPRHEAELGFRIGGKIVERRVDVGAAVKKGAVLARLDPADVMLQTQGAEAAVAAARTEDAYAKAEYARYENLYRQKFVSESALDQKRNAMNAAAARLEQARSTLAVTRNQAGYATLVAPDDGVVTAVVFETGQVVSAGQPVLKLARSDEREVAIAVPEARLDEIRRAQRLAVVLIANPQKPYSGRVREISPAVDAVTRTFAVRVAVPDADAALAWGMTANVVVAGEGVAGGALVPLPSIYHQPDGKPAVWVYDPSTQQVALRAVDLGPYREDGALVTRGIASGEWIVAAGVNKLQPGQTVRPFEAPGAAVPPVARAGVTGRAAPVATR